MPTEKINTTKQRKEATTTPVSKDGFMPTTINTTNWNIISNQINNSPRKYYITPTTNFSLA